MTTLFWSERTSKPERQYIGHNHVNPNAIRAGRRGTNAIEILKEVSHAHSSIARNGSRDIAVFILVGLAALAVFSFAWAGIRVIEQSRFLSPSIASP